MIAAASDGWFIQTNGRSYHVTVEWCDEMWRHQFKHNPNPAFNRLRYLVNHGEGTADVIESLFTEAIGGLGSSPKPSQKPTPDTKLHDWIKEQRANR